MLSAALVLLLVQAQAPSQAPASPPAPPAAVAARDPFAAPRASKSDPSLGLRGMTWQDLRLASVVDSPRGLLATLDGGAAGSFFAREGDALANAVVVKLDLQRRAAWLREQPAPADREPREIVLTLDSKTPIVRERAPAEPILKVK